MRKIQKVSQNRPVDNGSEYRPPLTAEEMRQYENTVNARDFLNFVEGGGDARHSRIDKAIQNSLSKVLFQINTA